MNNSFWQNRSTFVTGATGLVGGWVVKALLEKKADVVCLLRDWIPDCELVQSGDILKVKTIRGDLRDQETLERILVEYEIQTVIHLAAQAIVPVANRNPSSTFETNIGGTWKLLEACRAHPLVGQIVIASSDKAYGECDKLPYTEDAPLQGRYPYDVSKSCADLIAQAYVKTFNLPLVITRCGNFYGGGDLNWNRLIPGTIRAILQKQAPVIRSNGKSIRDYFYVEDGAAAYLLLAEQIALNPAIRGEAFNFSSNTPVSVLDLVTKIMKLMDPEKTLGLAPVIQNEAAHEIPNQYLSSAKAQKMLNWLPLFSLEEGLARTIEWYKKGLLKT